MSALDHDDVVARGWDPTRPCRTINEVLRRTGLRDLDDPRAREVLTAWFAEHPDCFTQPVLYFEVEHSEFRDLIPRDLTPPYRATARR